MSAPAPPVRTHPLPASACLIPGVGGLLYDLMGGGRAKRPQRGESTWCIATSPEKGGNKVGSVSPGVAGGLLGLGWSLGALQCETMQVPNVGKQ